MKNKKGFTLIELLAVIVILGLLMAIAIPSVTKFITESRKKTLVTTIGSYIDAISTEVNDGTYKFSYPNTIFAVPIECIDLEKGGNNPFGEWYQVNDEYWAYVLVQYDNVNYNYNYGFTFKDNAGYGMYPINQNMLYEDGRQIKTDLVLSRPRTGMYYNFTSAEVWEESGFKVDDSTSLKVLKAVSDGTDDGENTCPLMRKGSNFEKIEEEKNRSSTLINSGTNDNNVFGKEISKSSIEAIYTKDYINIQNEVIDSWDASVEKNETIIAWITDIDNNNLYELYIGREDGLKAPQDSSYLFRNYTNLKNINLDNFDTSNVTNMSYMFSGLTNLTEIDLSKLNTSKVRDMSYMFNESSKIKNLNLSNFNTSNVTNMRNIFSGMTSLTILNISSFDTSKVTKMQYMFDKTSSLTSINVSNFNTSSVTDMHNMFSNMTSLLELDLSNFNTENVTNMSSMFNNSNKLTRLNISGFNTSKVTNFGYMFYNLRKMTEIDVSNFDTRNATNLESMFQYCTSVKELNVNHFNTSKVTGMYAMFAQTFSLTTLDLSNFDTSKVQIMSHMFAYNENLKTLKLNKATFDKVSSSSQMFINVPANIYIIAKDDTRRNWLQERLGSGKGTIVTVDELN